MDKLVEIHLKKEHLEKYGLPNIGYPAPLDNIQKWLFDGGVMDFGKLLYYLQEYSSQYPDKWPNNEAAMQRLVEMNSVEGNPELIPVDGDGWFFYAGKVDLGSKVVTIQRKGDLIAAMAPHEDGSLVLSVYHPLDARSISKVLALSVKPDPEYGVCMRENNWEYALDASAQNTSALYGHPGAAYLSYWESGVGIEHDGSKTGFYSQRTLTPISGYQVAVQIGTFYENRSDEALN